MLRQSVSLLCRSMCLDQPRAGVLARTGNVCMLARCTIRWASYRNVGGRLAVVADEHGCLHAAVTSDLHTEWRVDGPAPQRRWVLPQLPPARRQHCRRGERMNGRFLAWMTLDGCDAGACWSDRTAITFLLVPVSIGYERWWEGGLFGTS
jgi:hypothetical protein